MLFTILISVLNNYKLMYNKDMLNKCAISLLIIIFFNWNCIVLGAEKNMQSDVGIYIMYLCKFTANLSKQLYALKMYFAIIWNILLLTNDFLNNCEFFLFLAICSNLMNFPEKPKEISMVGYSV